jgi:hypothetical protein
MTGVVAQQAELRLGGRVAMTETLVGVNPPSLKDPADPPSTEELAAARELVRQARAQGVALTGPGGLFLSPHSRSRNKDPSRSCR